MVLLLLFIFNAILSIKLISKFSWRLSFCLSLQAFALLSFLFVEILGFFDAIGFYECLVFWAICTIVPIFFNVKYYKSRPKFDSFRLKGSRMILFSIIIFVLTFISGALYAPNTIDSTVYHLTRVEFWLQHRNIDYFATQTDRMLYQPPLAEYMLLQFRVLQDSDTFSFIIQWIFMIGSCVGVSLLAELAGLTKKTQNLTFFVASTIPIGILQSSSTQNDIVVSFFIVMTAYFLIKNLKENQTSASFLSGVSIGQAILTKGTAYVFLFPMCMFWGIMKLIKIYKKEVKFLPQLLAFGFLVVPFLAICGSFYYRNFMLLGSPLGVSKELFYEYNNQSHSLTSFLSVFLRNISLHFTVPGVQLIVEKLVFFIHQYVLLIDINDPATSFCLYELPMIGLTEDNAGNFLHFILFIPAVIVVFRSKNKVLKTITFFALIGFLLFCFQIKWQVWHSRLHIPVFLLMSISLAFLLEKLTFSKSLLFLLGVSALMFATLCFYRPLIKLPPITTKTYFTQARIKHFYTMQENLGQQMETVVRFLKENNFKKIAVKSEEPYGNDILYPIMYELRHTTKFYPIQMTNQTKVLDTNNSPYDAILYFTVTPPEQLMVDRNYNKMKVNAENLYIFAP